MHIVKADKALSRKSPDEWKRHSLIVVSFDNLKEINSKNLKYHDEMLPVWTMVDERVQELGAVRALRDHSKLVKSARKVLVILVVALDRLFPLLCLPVLGYLIKDVHLIIGSLNIVLRTFLNL